jgi:hypothetical protein
MCTIVSGGRQHLTAVVDRSTWPVVTVSVGEPDDLNTLADELEVILAEEQPFALAVLTPQDIDTLQQMLWDAPDARRRLRHHRAALSAWCEATAHVLTPHAHERITYSALRYAGLIWGCAALAARSSEEAADLLLSRLLERPLPLEGV